MDIDFDETDRVNDFITVPAGTYLCRVAEVRPGLSRAGDERWSIRLVVAEGQYVGKQAAWDSVVFSNRGRGRARIVFQALGLPAKGRVQVQPSDLEGRQAFVEVRPAEYANPSGEVVRRNEVPYDGYRACETGADAATGPRSTRQKSAADGPDRPDKPVEADASDRPDRADRGDRPDDIPF
jgi:hypothetical protein